MTDDLKYGLTDEMVQMFAWLNWTPLPQDPCTRMLHDTFPDALPGRAVHDRVRRVLMDPKLCFTVTNTLFASSICPDEINNNRGGLADLMKDFWGEVFPM